MGKNNVKLIVADIDGTLINDNKEMPENFVKLMSVLEKLNIIFVAASGRGIPSIENKLKYKSDHTYLISDNGAILKHKDKVHFQNNFTKQESDEIIAVFRKCKEVSIAASMVDFSLVELNQNHNEDYLKEFNVNYKIVDDITGSDAEYVKITMRSDHNTTDNFDIPEVQALKNKYHLVRSGPTFINIMKKDTNKGKALEFLLDHLNIDKENTIGFGDFPNDIHMLEVVGKSYAMCDGHEDVIGMADEVIGSNNDNSVIKKILELLDIEL